MSSNDLVTRTLLLSRKSPNILLVSRGVPDGDELKAEALSSGLSQIRAFDLTPSQVYDFSSQGQVLGWGLRNSVGVAEHPVTGGIFAVENSMDGVTRNGVDIHENNPAEELNYLGVLDSSSQIDESKVGKNYGFPSCFAVWEVDEVPDHQGLRVGDQFAVDERDGQVTDEDCNNPDKFEGPKLAMPAHWAPLDIKFGEDGKEAFVSFHGSCE